MSVKDRLKLFLKSQNVKITTYEKAIGAANGYVNSITRSIGIERLESTVEYFPNLNIHWLFTGSGSMVLVKSENEYRGQVNEETSEYKVTTALSVEEIIANKVFEKFKPYLDSLSKSEELEAAVAQLVLDMGATKRILSKIDKTG